jgi:hypothetical protein
MTAFMQVGDDYRVHIQPSNLQPPSGGFRFNGEVRYEARILFCRVWVVSGLLTGPKRRSE